MTKQNVYKRLRDLEKEVKILKEQMMICEEEKEEETTDCDSNMCELYIQEVNQSSILEKAQNLTLLLVPTLLAWGISIVALYVNN